MTSDTKGRREHVHDGEWCRPCLDHGATKALELVKEANEVRATRPSDAATDAGEAGAIVCVVCGFRGGPGATHRCEQGTVVYPATARHAPSASADAAWEALERESFLGPAMPVSIIRAHRPAIEAAIRAECPALDVERLRQAMGNVWDGRRVPYINADFAVRVAAEYARLADTPNDRRTVTE